MVGPLKINKTQTHNSPNNVQLQKDDDQMSVDIDGLLDENKHFNCMWIKRLVTNRGSCEVIIKYNNQSFLKICINYII